MYNFDKIYNRKASKCFKYDAMEIMYGRDDLLALWVADMDFATAPEIIEDIKQRIDHPIFGYNFKGFDYFTNFINYVEKRHNWSIKSEWLQMSPGIVPAINFLIKLLTNEGDKVVIQQPVYAPFSEAVRNHNRELLINELVETDGYYTMDYEDLDKKLANAKVMIFCSPHNPIGRVWKEEELLKLGRLCKKHNVILISDEIHNDLIYMGNKHVPIAMLEDFSDFTITAMAPSKTFNIAGLQSSVLIVPNEDLLKRVKKYFFDIHVYGSNSIGNVAFNSAYTKGQPWLEELLVYLEANADYLVERINNITKLKMLKPEGTFLAWVDFRQTGLNDEEIKELCVNKAGLALNQGITFGNNGTGFMRLNFGCPKSMLIEAMDRLEEALKGV